MKQEPIVVFWFRRDLRFDDNNGLFNALKSGKKVLPLFVFDQQILDKLPSNDLRVNFIHDQLCAINKEFEKYNSGILIKKGIPEKVFESIFEEYNVAAVYTNHDYEPYAVKRDAKVQEICKKNSADFQTFKDQVVFEKDEITKADGKSYTVYTPYSKKWLDKFYASKIEEYRSENELNQLYQTLLSFPTLSAIGFEKSSIGYPTFCISKSLLSNYESQRNIPSKKGTSMISVQLRFGTMSIRKLAKSIDASQLIFFKELIWREFFMQIIHHFPYVVHGSFKKKYDQIPWRNSEEDFKKWCDGKTGYPMVDAGMHELNATGYMHNRVRMVVASFLCKHLLIDWQWGAAYFAEKLIDFELSSNNGNWQWAAGCGCDAAPYFRVFNPIIQLEKFDPNFEYVKTWLPNFVNTSNYIPPMVEHKMARERAIRTYKDALQ
jgi:deoxyribodipyrimidine photo-lyase